MVIQKLLRFDPTLQQRSAPEVTKMDISCDPHTSSLFRVVDGAAGFGTVGLNRSLGFDAAWPQQIFLPDHLHDYDIISAHAPSDVRIECFAPVSILGMLNGSSTYNFLSRCEWWADYNYLGGGVGPWQGTRPVILEPGFHTLQARSLGASHGHHSLWCLKRATERGPTLDDAASAHNTAFVTIGSYSTDQVFEKLRFLAMSAANAGVALTVVGVGEAYGHYASKIAGMRRWLTEIPGHIKYVVYLDANDSLLLPTLDNLYQALNRYPDQVLLSAEACCWPVRDSRWIESFPATRSERRWPCAGVWAGRLSTVLAALDRLIQIRNELDPAKPSRLEDLRRYPHVWDDDQFLWGVAYKHRLIDIRLDDLAEFAWNVTCCGNQLPNNGTYDWRSRRLRKGATAPAILHFSASKGQPMHTWTACLDAFGVHACGPTTDEGIDVGRPRRLPSLFAQKQSPKNVRDGHVLLESRHYTTILPPNATLGLVIGTFSRTPYVHLQLEAHRRFSPDIPVLVHDDCSPDREAIEELCSRYGAAFTTTASRRGHILGDMAVFSVGLRWAALSGLDMLCKFSVRSIPTAAWIPELRELFRKSDYPTYCGRCDHLGWGFLSDAVVMAVRPWLSNSAEDLLNDAIARGDYIFAEGFVHKIAIGVSRRSSSTVRDYYDAHHPKHQDHEGYCDWPFLHQGRFRKSSRRLWHDADGPEEYHALSHSWGLNYPVDAFA